MLKKGMTWLLTSVFVFSLGITTASATPVSLSNAATIHENAVVVDSHNDTMMKVLDSLTWLPKNDIGLPTTFQLDLPKAKTGGLDVAFYAAFTRYYDETLPTKIPRTNSRTLALINAMYFTEKTNPDAVRIVTDIKGINQAVKDGIHAMVPALEGAYALDESNAIELLHQYYDLGIRYVTLVWNPANSLGAGTTGPADMGLTELGKQVISEMNRLGMIVDVSHMNETTFWDTVNYSKGPIMASHSSVYNLVSHVRNLKDEQILAVAKSGGVVNINFWDALLASGRPATVSDLVDHIDYIVDLVGPDHVGLGSDFDGATMPVDLPNASFLPLITQELIARGYSKNDIAKIMGLNTLRVMKAVENLSVNNPALNGVTPNLDLDLEMGEIIEDDTPIFTAEVSTNGKALEPTARVIVDGIVQEAMIESGNITLEWTQPLLKNNFHVVTIEVSDLAGKIGWETVIFYVK